MLKALLRHHFSSYQEGSIAQKFRLKRMRYFEERFYETFRRKIDEGEPV